MLNVQLIVKHGWYRGYHNGWLVVSQKSQDLQEPCAWILEVLICWWQRGININTYVISQMQEAMQLNRSTCSNMLLEHESDILDRANSHWGDMIWTYIRKQHVRFSRWQHGRKKSGGHAWKQIGTMTTVWYPHCDRLSLAITATILVIVGKIAGFAEHWWPLLMVASPLILEVDMSLVYNPALNQWLRLTGPFFWFLLAGFIGPMVRTPH